VTGRLGRSTSVGKSVSFRLVRLSFEGGGPSSEPATGCDRESCTTWIGAFRGLLKPSIKRAMSGSSSHLFVCCANVSQGLSADLGIASSSIVLCATVLFVVVLLCPSFVATRVVGGGLGGLSCGKTLVGLGALDSHGKMWRGGEGSRRETEGCDSACDRVLEKDERRGARSCVGEVADPCCAVLVALGAVCCGVSGSDGGVDSLDFGNTLVAFGARSSHGNSIFGGAFGVGFVGGT